MHSSITQNLFKLAFMNYTKNGIKQNPAHKSSNTIIIEHMIGRFK